jgi:hypothetical protein
LIFLFNIMTENRKLTIFMLVMWHRQWGSWPFCTKYILFVFLTHGLHRLVILQWFTVIPDVSLVHMKENISWYSKFTIAMVSFPCGTVLKIRFFTKI